MLTTYKVLSVHLLEQVCLLGQIGYKKISNNNAQIVRLSEPKLHLHMICILSYDCEN